MSQATDDNITKFPTPPEKPPELIDDEWLFQAVQKWEVARASQVIAWAKRSAIDLDGIRPVENEPDTKELIAALDEMETLQWHISEWTPKSTLTLGAMLEMVVEILAYREAYPKHPFAHGPVLQIVRNCKIAIERFPALPAQARKI